jgi:hypothetical protein
MSELFEDPALVAAEAAMDLVLPAEDQLFIDLDEVGNLQVMQRQLQVLAKNGFAFVIDKQTVSKSGRRHAYIRTDLPISPTERIALQACLGSDLSRELLSLLRIIAARRPGMETVAKYPPTVFFEIPESVRDLQKLLASVAQAVRRTVLDEVRRAGNDAARQEAKK